MQTKMKKFFDLGVGIRKLVVVINQSDLLK